MEYTQIRYLNILRFLNLTLAHFLQLCISFLFQRKILLLQVKLSYKLHAHNMCFTNLPTVFDYSMKSLSLLYMILTDLCVQVLRQQGVFPVRRNRCQSYLCQNTIIFLEGIILISHHKIKSTQKHCLDKWDHDYICSSANKIINMV